MILFFVLTSSVTFYVFLFAYMSLFVCPILCILVSFRLSHFYVPVPACLSHSAFITLSISFYPPLRLCLSVPFSVSSRSCISFSILAHVWSSLSLSLSLCRQSRCLCWFLFCGFFLFLITQSLSFALYVFLFSSLDFQTITIRVCNIMWLFALQAAVQDVMDKLKNVGIEQCNMLTQCGAIVRTFGLGNCPKVFQIFQPIAKQSVYLLFAIHTAPERDCSWPSKTVIRKQLLRISLNAC